MTFSLEGVNVEKESFPFNLDIVRKERINLNFTKPFVSSVVVEDEWLLFYKLL